MCITIANNTDYTYRRIMCLGIGIPMGFIQGIEGKSTNTEFKPLWVKSSPETLVR